MEIAAEVLFWIAIIGIGYSYFIYPVLLHVLVKLFGQEPRGAEGDLLPITIIIAVHNEAKSIAEKLQSLAELDYPKNLLRIVVASDASDDTTDEIVKTFKTQGVDLVRSDVRRGKEWAQKLAIEQSGEAPILVFTDASVKLDSASLKRISRVFSANSDIAAISSVDRYIESDGRTSGEGLYVKYEMWVRALESCWGGLVGLSGSFFAARREVCRSWRVDLPSDLNVALSVAITGKLAISDPNVVGIYKGVEKRGDEFFRKVRTINRGIATIWENRRLLASVWMSRFGFQLISHKLLRWLVPIFYLTALCLGAFLFADNVWACVLTICLAGIAVVGISVMKFPKLQESQFLRIIAFFVEVNCAALYAFCLFLIGKRFIVWSPTKR